MPKENETIITSSFRGMYLNKSFKLEFFSIIKFYVKNPIHMKKILSPKTASRSHFFCL